MTEEGSMNESRYICQQLFRPIHENGQRRIENYTVLVAGLGVLGSKLCNHLIG